MSLIILSWLGAVFIVAGLWRMGNKYRDTFVLQSAGNMAWATVAYSRSAWPLMALSLVLILLSVRCYIKWGASKQ